MSGENRTAIIAKLVKVAKKHYPAVSPPASRSVLENLLYACLLENSSFTAADEAFARLEQYSDWNEIRVTTTQELCELSAGLSDPQVAVERLKLALHSIFEAHYVFELDFLLKENQGKVVAQLEKYKGITPFVVAYLVQNSFGGHKIPTCDASLNFAEALGIVTPKEKETGTIPGFERAVPKTKGPEFFSTMHQFAVEFNQAHHDKQIMARVKEISLDAFKRLEAVGQVSKASPPKSGAGKPDSSKTDSGAAVGTGNATNSKASAGKKTSVADGPEKAEAAAGKRTGGGKPSGSKSGGDHAGNSKNLTTNGKGKAEPAAVDSKAAPAKAATTKPVAAKSAAPKSSAKPAAKSPQPPAGKKSSNVKSAASEKPAAAKAGSGKKKPR
jgi:endonuclease-3